jgi:hypothetical protein
MKKFFLILMLLAGLGSSISSAQVGIVDCIEQKTISVAKIRGQVFDPTGVPIPGAKIKVVADDKSESISNSDENGRFEINSPSGHYKLSVAFRGFETTNAELGVRPDLLSIFHSSALKVILVVGSLDCPWVTTSNKEFKEYVKKHATQK